MGYVHADIELANPREANLESISVSALVDTGSLLLCIPEHIKVQLEDMDLVVSPSNRTITVNPENPNYPHSLVK